jgi:Trypsin.
MRIRMSLRRVWIATLLLIVTQAAMAAYKPDLTTLQQVPMYSTQLAATRSAVAAAAGAQSPHRFAVALPLPLSTSDGRWSQLPDGEAVWRVRVHSAQARMLSLALDQVHLPPGADLYFYDTAAKLVRGPYTAANVSADGRLWTPLVNGDSAVLEARMQAAEAGDFSLRLADVDHAYRSLMDGSVEPVARAAGACEVNVACPAGDTWQDQARAVAMITIGNTNQCTGTLINDAQQDGKPWFLTANHCGIGSSSSLSAASVQVYWNYQSASCLGSQGSIQDNQMGSTLVASGHNADFALLLLDAVPESSYNVYYAGWDARDVVPQSGADIHHPLGTPAKISLFSTPAAKDSVDLTTEGGAALYKVQAWAVHWSTGATESGSSGSPLFNQNQDLVGTLSGGQSACNGAIASPNGPDYFGRFTLAFNAIQPDLDPQNLGVIAVGGKDPGGADAPVVQGTVSGSGSGGGADPLLPLLLGSLLLLRRRRSGSRSH